MLLGIIFISSEGGSKADPPQMSVGLTVAGQAAKSPAGEPCCQPLPHPSAATSPTLPLSLWRAATYSRRVKLARAETVTGNWRNTNMYAKVKPENVRNATSLKKGNKLFYGMC